MNDAEKIDSLTLDESDLRVSLFDDFKVDCIGLVFEDQARAEAKASRAPRACGLEPKVTDLSRALTKSAVAVSPDR
jgi:hypothetical protein